MARIADADALLRHVTLFSACSDKELQHIASLLSPVTVPAGRRLITQGDVGREAYVVVSGTAAVSLGDERLATVGPGEPLGEMTLLDRTARRSATVTAETEMELLVLDPRAFSDLLDRHPSVTRALALALARRLREVEESLVS